MVHSKSVRGKKSTKRVHQRKSAHQRQGQKLAASSPNDARARLLIAGKAQFLLDGAKGLSVRRVSSEAGVNLGLFVYYFQSKENFLQQIIMEHYKDFLRAFNVELEKTAPLATAREKLDSILLSMVSIGGKVAPVIVRLLVDTLSGQKFLVQAFLTNPPQHAIELMRLISEGQRSKCFRDDISPRLAFLLCMFVVLMPQILISQFAVNFRNPILGPVFDEILGEKCVRTRIDFVLKGLSP